MDRDHRACPHCGEPIRKQANICRFCNRDVNPILDTGGLAPEKIAAWVGSGIVFLLLLGGVIYHFAGDGTSKPSAATRLVSIGLPERDFTVPAGRYVTWTFTVPPDASNATLRGSYHASGGEGSDIIAGVASPSDFENWVHGHQSKVYYESPGQVTNGSIDLQLAPGTYEVGFSNRFSIVTDKHVSADVTLQYYQPRAAGAQ
jgi:hypothetical protein